MPYLDSNTRTANPTVNEKFQPAGRQTVYHGLFIGYVKRADDVQKNGRLSVWIPDLGSPPDEVNGWVTVSYCSPFAGATNVETISRTNFQAYETTQTSYGMWMVPPDINNPVAVMFIGGNPAYGVWLGCLYHQFMNHMVPGNPVNTQNAQFPGKAVPVAEYNKWNTTVTDPAHAQHPFHKTKFDGISNQGLIRDAWRGLTTSGARREAPSEVFGILTPGPAIDADTAPHLIRRKGGSAFIMDDKVGSEYVQLVTKSGAQIKIDETHGFVYLINRDGTGWVQMDYEGNIDVFGAKDISIRAQRDFNIRADRNINIEAGQNVFIKAAKDTVETTKQFTYDVNNKPKTKNVKVYSYVGEGKGDGGNLVTHALNNWHSTTFNESFITVQTKNINLHAQQSLFSTTVAGGQEFKSALGVKITTDASIDLLAPSEIRLGSGNGLHLSTSGDLSVCSKKKLSLNGDVGVAISSFTELGLVGYTRFEDKVFFKDTVKLYGYVQHRTPLSLTPGMKREEILQPNSPKPPLFASSGSTAEVKPLVDKINILPTWTDENKFIRDAEAIDTMVTRFPTFEPCPEHQNFRFSATKGYIVKDTPSGSTYEGSSGQGTGGAGKQPDSGGSPVETNNEIRPEAPSDSTVTKDFNNDAFRCQLIIHEGRKNTVYKDTEGLLTAGIGHLLRAPKETERFPLNSKVSDEQIEAWYSEDSVIAIRGATSLVGNDVWENLSDVRKRALADLCYNLGKARLSKFTKFLTAVKANDWEKAGTELVDSKWYGQVATRGPKIVTMITKNIDPNGCDKK